MQNKQWYKEYYAKNKEAIKARQKAHYAKNKKRIRAQQSTKQKEKYAANKDALKDLKSARVWGISVEQLRILKAGGCEACGTKDGVLCIDHCHTTDAIRGVLCRECNSALGFLREDKERLLQLAAYIDAKCTPLRLVKG